MRTTSLTAAVLLCALGAFPAFAGPVTDTNVTTARSNVATGGDAAWAAPACPIPLELGATWTYRGLVLWYSNEAIQSQEMTWVTTVVATYDGPAARAAVISGYPDELAWYEPGRTPKHSVLVAAGSNVYHINRAYRTNDCEKLTREECMALAQQLAQSPAAIPAEYQDKLPLLVLPLAKGAKWNDDKWRGDNWYCWYVQESWTTQVAQLAGRTAVVYEVIYLTNPDHSIMQIVPGLGITRYVYEHHGAPAAADMQLVSFSKTPGASASPADHHTDQLPSACPRHTVQRGDTLWSISRKYGCRISELAVTNALDPSAVLRVGQKLIVPVNQTIIASDDVQQDITVTTNNMVLIPAGAFTMGNCMDPGEGSEHELPVHTVMISAFYMDKTEVTKATWDEVYTWATNHRYSIDSGVNVAANHPARMVSWYDCVKWCNARSEKEGRTPCYTVGGNVYKSGKCAPDCNWSANGYRLPTEAEWEKAARGGLNGRRFPWNDLNITHTNACYDSSPCYAYDTSVTRGFHPAFNGTYPYTIPVGYFANGYGVYDMVGNVQEWCWDWYDDSYYASSPGSDPRGPASGTYRVLRGGGSGDLAIFCRVAYRSGALPDYTDHVGFGFRCVRGL